MGMKPFRRQNALSRRGTIASGPWSCTDILLLAVADYFLRRLSFSHGQGLPAVFPDTLSAFYGAIADNSIFANFSLFRRRPLEPLYSQPPREAMRASELQLKRPVVEKVLLDRARRLRIE
ncbi:unnamed protein product [Nippostrongylus brasiliensis]|uniref:GST_C_6 domain-containing protein n=1 Tax=Nippostrongylus brasiliensis TaxID=27835 RepID=A0A0N4XCX3_NIPBR|nr:unnamed protein product [Nippostrongylus brasiliensis]